MGLIGYVVVGFINLQFKWTIICKQSENDKFRYLFWGRFLRDKYHEIHVVSILLKREKLCQHFSRDSSLKCFPVLKVNV